MTPPSHIGQYRILRKIGAGGMGLVYLGEHTLLGRPAAIKTLLPAMSSSPEIVERFFNEARAASAIHDSGVVQVFDFGYHVDGTAYIVMELLEGEAISSRIARLEKIAVGDALRMARQIASSLATAHACDIVHRDLKPENIFLVADAEAQGGERTKILDFGICKLGTGDVTLTQTGAMVGTPVYMSPEQCRGDSTVDGRSDIYAFGCLLFHMLTGRPPFIGETSGDLIVAHLEDEPPAASTLVPGVPVEVDALIKQCMAKAREDRYQSMSDLAHELGELHAKLDVPATAVEPIEPATPLGRGFRSLYDGNFTGHGPSSSVRRRLPWLRSDVDARRATADSQSLPRPRKRTELKVALGCLLTAGVILGLLGTTSLFDGDHAESASAASIEAEAAVPSAHAAPMSPAPMPTMSPPPMSPPPMPTTAPGASVQPVAEPAPETAPPAIETTVVAPPASATATIEHSRRLREPAREVRQPKPRRTLEVERTPVPPHAAVSPTPPAPTAPAAPAATPPSEDLYETR